MAPRSRPNGNPKRFCSHACQKWAYLNPGKTRTRQRGCENCGQSFRPKYETSRFCTRVCGEVARGARVYGPHGAVITCVLCEQRKAVPMDWGGKTKTCLDCRSEWERRRGVTWRTANPEKTREMWQRKSAKRRLKRQGRRGVVENVPYLEVYDRDGWRCGLCGKAVRKSLRYPHPQSATLDHIIPIALGGDHTLANVQLAHWGCNRSKRTAARNEQLRLVG